MLDHMGGGAHQDHDDHDESPTRSSTHSSNETKVDDEKEYPFSYDSTEAHLGEDEKAKRVEAELWPVEERPRTPLPAVTRSGGERFMSIDSYVSGSSEPLSPTETLGRNDRSFTLVLDESSRFCTSPNKEGRSVQRKDSSNIAAPAHIVARPHADDIATTLPSIRTRYDKPIKIGRKYHDNIIFGPLTTKRIYEKQSAACWQSYMHPDGLRYFYWKKGDHNTHHFSYLTDDNVCDPEVREEIEDFVSKLEETADRFRDQLPEDAEVVLQIEQNADVRWHYYIADLEKKELFWLHNFDASWIANLLDGVDCLTQLKHYLDFEFWSHIENFPCHRKLYAGLLEELMGYTTHGCIDTMTSLDSTAPYSASHMRDLSGLVKQLISLNRSGKANDYIISASARLMSIIANERFWNFAGSHGARIVRDQSVRGVTYVKSWLIRILSPLLFFAPELHLHSLEKIWVDGHITQCHWAPFLERLETDWEQFILYSTVLLTANVSFLAIPTVISNQGPLIWASPAQIFSQVSIVCSLGSIILGLLLVRQHRRQTRESADDAAQFLERRSHRQLGREILAIMYSLPYALLMWGMLTFLPSIGITCFMNIQGSIEGLLPRIVYGVTWFAVLCLIFWTALTGWETTAKKSWRELIPFWGFWRKKRDEAEQGADKDADTVLSDSVSICSTASSTRSWSRRIGKLRVRLAKSKKDSMNSLDGIILAGANPVQ